jgi:hypothetical protein
MMANKHPAIVEMFEQLIIGALKILWYAKLNALLHLLSYFPLSLSSWKTSCDIKQLEVQQL